ncbi:hypothetical protein NBRC116188_28950 [Oceaniserpentilla sp. 4NH20-0058]|uniref:hypothetical protein n=1 Tax=Oceaniserpentilla sp. 4NH20-0058 TaxID=3127660 RepID=UPI0031083932
MPYLLFIALLFAYTSNTHANAFGISELKPYETWLEVGFSNQDSTTTHGSELRYGQSSNYQAPSINYIDTTETPKLIERQAFTIARAFTKQFDQTYTPIIGLTYQEINQETGHPNFTYTDYDYVESATYLTKLSVGASLSNKSNLNYSSFLFTQQSNNSFNVRNQSGIEFGIRYKNLFDIADNKLNVIATYFEKSTHTSGGHSLTIENNSLFTINHLLKFDVKASLTYKSNESNRNFYSGVIYSTELIDPEALTDENGIIAYEELYGGEPQLIVSEYSTTYDYIYSYGASFYFQPFQNISFKLSAEKNLVEGTRDQSSIFNINQEVIGLSLVSYF